MASSSLTSRGWFPWIIFFLGLGLFGYFQFSLVYKAWQPRAALIEVDDAYGYINKTPQMAECFNQDCPALNDLRAQFTPSPGDANVTKEDMAFQKWIRYMRVIPQFHPGYSLGLWALTKGEGVSLEVGYRQLWLLWSLGLVLALAWFFVKLADPVTAGVTLATLALTIFPAQGIHYVVPSNMALGVGLLMFAYLVQRRGRPDIVFYVLNLVALGLHPMGLAYVGMAAAFGVALRYPELKTRAVLAYLPSFGLMVGYWGLINLLPRPTMALLPQIMIKPSDTSYGKELIYNFNQVSSYLRSWRFDHGWPVKFSLYWFEITRLVWGGILLASLGLGYLGLRCQPGWCRWPLLGAAAIMLLPMGFTLGMAAFFLLLLVRGLCDHQGGSPLKLQLAIGIITGCLIFSCLAVFYRPDLPLAVRIYVFWAIAATLIWARGLVLMAQDPGIGSFLTKYLPVPITFRIPTSPIFWRSLLAAFVFIAFISQLPQEYKYRLQTLTSMINRQDIYLDQSQPRLMLKLTSPEDIILYGEDSMQILLPFFLSHGALQRRAVYLPFLPQSSGPVYDPAHIKLLVAMNPYLTLSTETPAARGRKLSKTLKNYLKVSPGETLTLELEPGFRVDSLKIQLISGKAAATGRRLILTRTAGGRSTTRELALSSAGGSYTFPAAAPGGSISLSNPDKDRSVALGGLRLGPGPDAGSQWPWAGVTKVILAQPGGLQPQSFAVPREYVFQGRHYRLEMLKDRGFSIMWKLTPMPPSG